MLTIFIMSLSNYLNKSNITSKQNTKLCIRSSWQIFYKMETWVLGCLIRHSSLYSSVDLSKGHISLIILRSIKFQLQFIVFSDILIYPNIILNIYARLNGSKHWICIHNYIGMDCIACGEMQPPEQVSWIEIYKTHSMLIVNIENKIQKIKQYVLVMELERRGYAISWFWTLRMLEHL